MLPFAASARHLLQHRSQLLLTLAGLVLGVATITAVDLAARSARTAFEASLDTVNGRATHQIVAGATGIDETLYVQLRRAGIVSEIAPVVSGYANVKSARAPSQEAIALAAKTGDATATERAVEIIGIDVLAEAGMRELTGGGAQTLKDLKRFMIDPGTVMLSARTASQLGLSASSQLKLDIGGRQFDATLVATLDDTQPGIDTLLITDIAQAQEWLDTNGRLSRIDVRIENEAQRRQVNRVLPAGTQLVTTERSSRALVEMTAAFTTNLRALSLLALLVSAFLVFNCISFAVVQRRETLATLRALGATRSQVLTVVLIEALLLGIVGAALGALLGTWIAQQLLGLVTRTINDLYFVVSVTDITPNATSALIAFASGPIVALLAAAAPAAEAARQPPRLGLQRSALESGVARGARRLVYWGIALAIVGALTIALSERSLIAGFTALALVMLAAAFFAPATLLVLSRAGGQVVSGLSANSGRGSRLAATMRLAIGQVAASLSRTGVAAAALCIALAAALGVAVMIGSFRESLREWLEHTLRADIYVTAPGPGFSRPERFIDPHVITRLLATPGVIDHSASRRVTVETPGGGVRLDAIQMARESYAGITFVEGEAVSAWPAFARGAVLVSEPRAFRAGRGVGDTETLLTPDGPRTFPIAGVYRDYGNDTGVVLMNRDTYREQWRDEAITSLGLYVEKTGAAGDEAARARTTQHTIEQLHAAAGSEQSLLIRSNRDIRELSMAIFERTFAITQVLYWLAAGVAALGLLSALLAYELERARELALLRALGVTPRGLGALITAQTGFIGLAVGAMAVPVGIVAAWLLVAVINRRAFGWHLDLYVKASDALAVVGIGVAAALAAALYPAWRAARMSIAATIRED